MTALFSTNQVISWLPYGLHPMLTAHCVGFAAWTVQPRFSSKNVHLPYCFPFSRSIFGRSIFVLNISASSRNFSFSSSTLTPSISASFSSSPFARNPLPILHPCSQALQRQAGAISFIFSTRVFLVIVFILTALFFRLL